MGDKELVSASLGTGGCVGMWQAAGTIGGGTAGE